MKKIKTALVGVVAAFMICLVGWICFSTIISSVSFSNDYTAANTTSAIQGSGTITNVLGLFLIPLVAMIIIMTLVYFSSRERYEKLGSVLEFLVSSAYYFGYGVLALVVILLPSYLLYLLYNYTVLDGHAGDIVPVLQWVGIAVGLFFGIAGLGYLFKKKIVDKYIKIKKDISCEKKVKKTPKVE